MYKESQAFREAFKKNRQKLRYDDFNDLEIDFPSFARTLARFRPMSKDSKKNTIYNDYKGKMQFLFRMFDLDDDYT